MSNPKLPTKRLEQIRKFVLEASDPPASDIVKELLAELDRTRPAWVPVAAGQHNYGDLYHVAGLPNEGQPPRWVGRGRYDAHSELWMDDNTDRPFTHPITHFLLELTPTQLIGQPDGEEFAAQ